MKRVIVFLSLIFYVNSISAQKLNIFLSGELGGSTIFYGIGGGTALTFKDNSKIGLKISSSYVPRLSFTNGNLVPLSFQVDFSPGKILNGKSYIRTGTSFIFAYKVQENSTYKDLTYNCFNIGLGFNVLKKRFKSQLFIGADAILSFKTLGYPDRGSVLFVPIPTLQYRYNFTRKTK